MGFLKGLLSAVDGVSASGEDSGPSAFARAEAALDKAIQQRNAAASGNTAAMPASSTARLLADMPAIERRQGEGVRPDGLPDRRSGLDRRNGAERRGSSKEFGRRSQRPD